MQEKKGSAQQRFNEVYNTIRKRICTLEYEPGKRLSEERLAAEFNISRTPIRRVLSTLENEGMVNICHGAGNYVSSIELDYLSDSYAMRMELIMLVGQRLKNPMPTEVITGMQALLQKGIEAEQNDANTQIFAEVNLELFELTMEMIASRALRELLSSLFYNSSRMWPYLMKDHSTLTKEFAILNEEIRDLVRVLENGYYNSIPTIIRYHVEMAMYRIQSYCQGETNA